MDEARVALVTGGGSGIGAACALRLAQAGWRVMINGRTESKLRSVAEQDRHIQYFVGDVSQPNLAEKLVYHSWGQLGRLDLLIHAAGIFPEELTITNLSLGQWQETIDGNVTSTFFVSQAVAQIMQKHQHSGLIIIVSSLAGLWQYMLPGRMAYNVANAAKVAMAVTYVQDMQPLTRCQAMAVCFGLVETPMTAHFLKEYPSYRDQALSPTQAADYLYQLIESPPACPVIMITKQKGAVEATHTVWQPAPSIE